MKTYKNIWATLFIAMVWGGFMVVMEAFRFGSSAGFMYLFGVSLALFLTYQTLRVSQYIPDVLEKQEPLRRSRGSSVDWLHDLKDDDLDMLRQRLADLDEQDYESLEYLLAESGPKRKNR